MGASNDLFKASLVERPGARFGFGDTLQCSDGTDDEAKHTVLCSVVEDGEFLRHLCLARSPKQTEWFLTSFGDANPDVHLLGPYSPVRWAIELPVQILDVADFVRLKPAFIPFLRKCYEEVIQDAPLPECLKE